GVGVDVVAQLRAGEAAVDHAVGHDLVGPGRVQGQRRVVGQVVADAQVLAHPDVIGLPGQLHIAAAVVDLPGAVGGTHRVAVGMAAAHAELRNRVIRPGALPLHGGQHVGDPAHVADGAVVRERTE